MKEAEKVHLGMEKAKDKIDLFTKCREYTLPQQVKAMGYYPYFRPISSNNGTEVMIEGKKLLMIGSNNYLGLTTDERVKEAAIAAIKRYGSSCTGSRFLNGTLELHEELEDKLAKFLNKEAALVFSTGFQSNLGAISCIVDRRDLIITDRSDHASIVDGCRLSFGKTIKFAHNDMKDLKRVMDNLDKDAPKLLVVDGVFSMEGDICNLPEIVKIAKENNAKVMVDDAHAVGVLGKTGRGTGEHFEMDDDVDIVMGTFSKSFASLGGVIASKFEVINYIKHVSRALIFSASMPPASVAAVLKSLEIIKEEPERRKRLWDITKRMHKEFKSLGFKTGTSTTPIIPIYIGEDMACFKFWRDLTDEGLFTNPIVSPAVPPGSALIRTSYSANLSDSQLDKVLDVFKRVGKKFGLI
jgi:8-amino-7-oxononanoate synthase